MIKIQYKGRLGNNLIQYAAAHLFACHTGIKLDPNSARLDFIKRFNISPPKGKIFKEFIDINESNYFEYLNNPKKNVGYNITGYYQTSEFLCNHRDFILDLYKCDAQLEHIRENDCFIHARIGDLLNNLNRNMAYFQPDYLEQQLQATRNTYNTAYISSDTINYPPLVELINKYGLTIYQNEPLDTILFAKNFNNLILSAGSFSYWMAYLSEATNITVYKNNRQDPLQKQNAWSHTKNVKFFRYTKSKCVNDTNYI